MNKWILFGILFIATWLIIGPWLGISSNIWHLVILVLAISLTVGLLGFIQIFPFKLKRQWSMILVVVLWGYLAFSYGWLAMFGNLMPTGAISLPTAAAISLTDCRAGIASDILGTSATLTTNAWDQESTTPYSAAVDLTTSCELYKNGNALANYIGPTSDTSAASITGFAVGDAIYVYCGGASYYTDPIEGMCVKAQQQPLSLNIHNAVAETDMQTTVYDNTGGTALDASASANYGDYNMTLGAGADDSIYVKLKQNTAVQEYRFCAWGVATFYNVTKVSPQNEEASYTIVATPVSMKSIAVEVNTTSNTLSKDYTVYRASSPIVLHQWDSIKEEFVVEADDTSDPQDSQALAASANPNGFAIIAKDCTWARGVDGAMHDDFYVHDTGQADIGVAETETSPRGKTVGVQILVK